MKRKYFEEKTTTTLKSKETSIATVRNYLRTVASLPTHLALHYPPLLRLGKTGGDSTGLENTRKETVNSVKTSEERK
jgi:hypothetical protein